MNTILKICSLCTRGILACVLFVCCLSAYGADSPWDVIAQYPDDADVILVLDNPAERILLGDSGVETRRMFAALSMFSETERAWASLAESFGLDPDDAIRALLSKRVVTLWDRMGDAANNPLSLITAADDHWVISAEIDHSFVKRAKKSLRLVARRIYNGHPVYTIEQGRYQIVVLDAAGGAGDDPRIILAPREGSALLDRVLDSLAENNADAADRSYLGKRSAEIVRPLDEGWVIAGVLAIDQFLGDAIDLPEAVRPDDERDPSSPPAVCSLVVRAEDNAWDFSFATDVRMDLPESAAPVALLGALGGDALFAMAYAGEVNLDPSGVGFSLGIKLGNGTEQREMGEQPRRGPGGSMMLVMPESIEDAAIPLISQEHESIRETASMTILTPVYLPGIADRSHAAAVVDRMIEPLVANAATGVTPQFNGQFPGTIRTQTKKNPDPETSGWGEWPGDDIRISWVCQSGRERDDMIMSYAPDGVNTARRVRWVSEAAITLEAISEPQLGSSSVLRGFLYPAELSKRMLSQQGLIISTLTGNLEKLSWDVDRTAFGIRGKITMHWNPGKGKGILGWGVE